MIWWLSSGTCSFFLTQSQQNSGQRRQHALRLSILPSTNRKQSNRRLRAHSAGFRISITMSSLLRSAHCSRTTVLIIIQLAVLLPACEPDLRVHSELPHGRARRAPNPDDRKPCESAIRHRCTMHWSPVCRRNRTSARHNLPCSELKARQTTARLSHESTSRSRLKTSAGLNRNVRWRKSPLPSGTGT